MRLRALILPALLALAPLGVAAQQQPAPAAQVQSPVLTIDVDRLLDATRFGRRLSADLQARATALRQENDRIFETLRAEELALTERRPSMEVEAFRAEAEAFDARAERIRNEQDAKEEALAASVEQDRRTFLNAVRPVLGRLMVESGAAVILDRREVFLSVNLVDITEEAVAAIDAELGDGSGIAAPEAPDGQGASAPEAPGDGFDPARPSPEASPHSAGDGG